MTADDNAHARRNAAQLRMALGDPDTDEARRRRIERTIANLEAEADDAE